MIHCIRTNSENPDFKKLVTALDADLAIRDGEEHAFFSQFNKISTLKYAIVAYENATPVGCGAARDFSADAMEIKRMYVPPEHRGKGIASKLLKELEQWIKDLNYSRCVLETGKKQPEAIALYKKHGYQIIPPYGQYKNVENSVCFEKKL